MPFEIVRNDITNMQVDVIVNAASRLPRVNSGVDSSIHKKAGPSLLEARKKIGSIQPGDIAITPAFALHAKYVIHAVTPIWREGGHQESTLLLNTYLKCLDLAQKQGCTSIAFPLLASGNHGFPKSKALQIAIQAFSGFLMEHDMLIYLVVFSKESVQLSEKLVHNISCYIDENYVSNYNQEVYGGIEERERIDRYRLARLMAQREERSANSCVDTLHTDAITAQSSQTLSDFIKSKDAGFTETLKALIEKSGQKNSSIYNKANMSKQHFSKIINDQNAKPSKQTALALALALELNLEQTADLIGRAGYALTKSSTFDLIIQYFIEHKKFNIIEINFALYEFDQSLLGNSCI